MVSQTVRSPSIRQGTLREGETAAMAASQFSSNRGISFSSKLRPRTFMRIHGRRDQEE